MQPSDEITVLLTGPVTLYEAAAVRDNLRAALAEGKPVRIDLSDSGNWDIAGLQLLISCVLTGRRHDQTVQLVHPPSACIEVARRSGLSDWLEGPEPDLGVHANRPRSPAAPSNAAAATAGRPT